MRHLITKQVFQDHVAILATAYQSLWLFRNLGTVDYSHLLPMPFFPSLVPGVTPSVEFTSQLALLQIGTEYIVPQASHNPLLSCMLR